MKLGDDALILSIRKNNDFSGLWDAKSKMFFLRFIVPELGTYRINMNFLTDGRFIKNGKNLFPQKRSLFVFWYGVALHITMSKNRYIFCNIVTLFLIWNKGFFDIFITELSMRLVLVLYGMWVLLGLKMAHISSFSIFSPLILFHRLRRPRGSLSSVWRLSPKWIEQNRSVDYWSTYSYDN